MVVGLTGQSGAGKTTVCSVFRENGYAVIDADGIARKIVKKGTPCLAELADYFGSCIIRDDGELDRRKLASIVFSDSSKLEVLNSISYPYITAEILEQIRNLSAEGKKLILLDAPTLFESRADDFCELIISVISKEEKRLQRIIARDKLTEEAARKRLSSQRDDRFFIQNSDFIIKNNKTRDALLDVAREVSEKVVEYYNKKMNII